jgi:uncharacterized protein YxeA
MKKVLISILIVLIVILTFFVVFKNINIGEWKSKNINDIKNLNSELEQKINNAKQLNNQDYPNEVNKLDDSMEKLKIVKKKYQNKMEYVSGNVDLGGVSIKNYKIERLWIALENYAKNENVELKLEVVDAASKGLYDLNITVAGEYIGITDFIYDIEKDDTLGFKILNFKLTPYVATTTTNNDTNNNTTSNTKNTDDQNQTTQTTTSTTSVRVDKLTATFKVEGVEIEFN